jgi:hypothetical protein
VAIGAVKIGEVGESDSGSAENVAVEGIGAVVVMILIGFDGNVATMNCSFSATWY